MSGEKEGVEPQTGTFVVKAGLAQMLKGGIIMDVINAEQARIAEEAGACAVMALEKVPADIRKDGGVARMADPKVRVQVKGGCGVMLPDIVFLLCHQCHGW